jgi:hypothetical protein
VASAATPALRFLAIKAMAAFSTGPRCRHLDWQGRWPAPLKPPSLLGEPMSR